MEIPQTINKQQCFDAFKILAEESSDVKVKNAFSASITFNGDEFKNWIATKCDEANKFDIVLAQYTQDFKAEVETTLGAAVATKVKVGRMSAMVVALKDNEEISSFNIGNINP